jgi:lipoic acid synthetase
VLRPGKTADSRRVPLPPWLRVKVGKGPLSSETAHRLAASSVSTVCQSARCPNIGECFSHLIATFLILGPRCTRACAFCAVPKGRPDPVDPDEPERVAAAAEALGSKHVVVTSTTRDDLPDGGAGQFVETIHAVRRGIPEATIEVLVPDFGGNAASIDAVLKANPDVLNHNVETVERLYSAVRPKADYSRSLRLLARGSATGQALVKSGFMVGLGEEYKEVKELLQDLYSTGCRAVTIGQYLRASRGNPEPARYVEPTEFCEYRREALGIGFVSAESGPFVRSSYRAKEVFEQCRSSIGQ